MPSIQEVYFTQKAGASAMENRYAKQTKGIISTSLCWSTMITIGFTVSVFIQNCLPPGGSQSLTAGPIHQLTRTGCSSLPSSVLPLVILHDSLKPILHPYLLCISLTISPSTFILICYPLLFSRAFLKISCWSHLWILSLLTVIL